MTIKSNSSSSNRRPHPQSQKNKLRSSNVACDQSRQSPLAATIFSGPAGGNVSTQSLPQASNETIGHQLNNLGSRLITRNNNGGQKRKQRSTTAQSQQKKRSMLRQSAANILDNRKALCQLAPPPPVCDYIPKRNSEDEYELVSSHDSMPVDQICQLEVRFRAEMRQRRGLRVKNMKSDGNCLFRAIADQVYGDEELHLTVRRKCMDHIAMNQASFCQYLTEDIDTYIARKRRNHEFGNYVEMIALSEVFRRSIELYHYNWDPSNTFCGERANVDHPMRISFHMGSHYNSIVEPGAVFIVPFSPEDMNTGPFLKSNDSAFDDGCEADPNLVIERDQIEQAMLDDKLRATDCEATDAEILQTVAQASYFEWLQSRQFRHQAELFQILEDIRQRENKIGASLNNAHCPRPCQTGQRNWTAQWPELDDALKGWPKECRGRGTKRANNCPSAFKRDCRSGGGQVLGVLPAKRAARKIVGRSFRSPSTAAEACPVQDRKSPGSSRELSPLSCSSRDSIKRK